MKIFHWIKSLGRAIAFLPVCLFVGVSVNAADLSFEVIAEGDGETAQNGMQVSVILSFTKYTRKQRRHGMSLEFDFYLVHMTLSCHESA